MTTDAFITHCLELLAPLGSARARRMFGGHGIYLDELFIAVVAADRLYLKVDAQTRGAFEDAGCEPFVYDTKTGSIAMGYLSVPPDALESPAAMRDWALGALQAALRSRAAQPMRRPRGKQSPGGRSSRAKVFKAGTSATASAAGLRPTPTPAATKTPGAAPSSRPKRRPRSRRWAARRQRP